MYFNGQGTRMAFAQFNDTEVMEFYYTKFGEPDDPLEVQVSTFLHFSNHTLNVCTITYTIATYFLFIVSWANHAQVPKSWYTEPKNQDVCS